MKHTVRAVLAVALLVGFYVAAIGLAVGVVALVVEAALLGVSGAVLAKFGILAAFAAFAIVRGLFSRRKQQDDDPGGMLVTEAQQPQLWAEVRALASAVGTRVPDEIRLLPDVNAAVSEDAKFLGLVPGTRRLFVGVPLLLGMTRGQVRSVLAHELGHYSGRHTALGPVTYRGKEAIARVLGELGPGSLLGKVLGLYGRLYYAVAHSVGRRQELEADEFSVRLAGRETAASALRELAPLDAAWGHFASSYASLGQDSGRRPADLFAGFAALLADPGTVEKMERIRAELPEPESSVYDTHPPLSQRIAVIEATTDTQAESDTAPALALLEDVGPTLNAFEETLFAGSGLSPARWEEIVEEDGARQVASASHLLASSTEVFGDRPTLAAVLTRLAQRERLGLNQSATPEQERAFVAGLVGDAAANALVRRQAASFQISWSGSLARLTAPDGTEFDPWTPAQTAAESFDVEPFRAWAAAHGVDLDAPLVPAESSGSADGAGSATEPDAVIGVRAPVKYRGVRALVVTRAGMLLVKVPWGAKIAFGFQVYIGRGGQALAQKMADKPLPDLLHDARTIAFGWAHLSAVHVVQRRARATRMEVTLADGSSLTVKFDRANSADAGQPWAALDHFLGERFTVAD